MSRKKAEGIWSAFNYALSNCVLHDDFPEFKAKHVDLLDVGLAFSKSEMM